jgi:NitT/TauT family transport system ATP-binding protein
MPAKLQLLPHTTLATVVGLLQHLEHAPEGREPLCKLGGALGFGLDDLVPVTEAGKRLGLVEVAAGDVGLTPEGRTIARAGDAERKKRLHRRLERVPLIARIRKSLVSREGGRVSRGEVVERLLDSFSPDEAERQIQTALDWARFAGLFDFDPDTEEFVLPE